MYRRTMSSTPHLRKVFVMKRIVLSFVGLSGLLACWACSSSSDSGPSGDTSSSDAGSTSSNDAGGSDAASSTDAGIKSNLDAGALDASTTTLARGSWGTVGGTNQGSCALQTNGLMCWNEPVTDTPWLVDGSAGLSRVVILGSTAAFPSDGGPYRDTPDFCGIQSTDATSVVCSTSSLNRTIPNIAYLQGAAGFACAIDTSGSLICWGDNNWGELGTGDQSVVTGTNTVSLPDKVTDVVLRQGGAVARLANGDVYAWGSEIHFSDYTIQKMDFGGPVAALANTSGGGSTWCAIMESGVVRCTGSLAVDDGDAGIDTKWIDIDHLAGAKALTLATYLKVCGLMSDGSVKCVDSDLSEDDQALPEKITEINADTGFVARGVSGAVYRFADGSESEIIAP